MRLIFTRSYAYADDCLPMRDRQTVVQCIGNHVLNVKSSYEGFGPSPQDTSPHQDTLQGCGESCTKLQ